MATVHLYEPISEGNTQMKETAAATMRITRAMNVEDIHAWFKVARKMFTRGRVPETFDEVNIFTDLIQFKCGTIWLIINRKRAML